MEGLQPPRGREKKKVGFASDNQPQTTSFPSSSYLTPDESQGAFQDYFSYTPSPYSNASTPRQGDGPARRDSFDREKVTAALTQILSSERESSPGPSKPRPVLRKPTALSSPVDLPTAPLRSEVEAKHRADRLAYSVGTASSPISRRPSFDFEHGTGEAPRDRSTASIAQDSEAAVNSDTIQPRKKAQLEADNLVRSHTRRKSPLIHSFAAPRSGTATPVEHDVDYVPQPDKYKGGILGTLLKLYSSEDRDRYGSQYADSSTPSTPGSTPPQSRPSTPKTEGRRRSWRPQSTSTLAGLMESSFMFAAPGSSGNISEAVSEKVKKEAEKNRKPSKSKKKLEEFRIKIHIAEIIKRHEYLIKLCKALMTYGAPTHRLEAYMRMSSRVLGIEGQFLYLPDTMIISFDDSNTHTTEVKILRASQGIDFGRLRDVHTIYKDVVHDRMGVEEATMRLHDVTERKAKFPVWFRIILYGIASAMVAPFGFEGRYIDMPICFILGCLVGFLQLYIAPSNELYNNVFEITAAVATSCLARAFGSIRGGSLFCFSSMAQSSIALILPGYMVLCASLELQSHQMISGSVRMVYALIYTLFLGYGFTIGSVIYGYMDKDAVSEVHCSVGDTWYTQRPPENFYLLFVFPFTLCLCFINQAKWKQTPGKCLRCTAPKNQHTNNHNSPSRHLPRGLLRQQLLRPLLQRQRHHLQLPRRPHHRRACKPLLPPRPPLPKLPLRHVGAPRRAPRPPLLRSQGPITPQPLPVLRSPRGRRIRRHHRRSQGARPRDGPQAVIRDPPARTQGRLRPRRGRHAARHLRAGAVWAGGQRVVAERRDERGSDHAQRDRLGERDGSERHVDHDDAVGRGSERHCVQCAIQCDSGGDQHLGGAVAERVVGVSVWEEEEWAV